MIETTEVRPAVLKPAWSPTAIAWMCVLFTLLPAGIMYVLNFERLGQPERRIRAFLILLIVAVVYYTLFIQILILPEFGMGPRDTRLRFWFQIGNIILGWSFYLSQQRAFVQYVRQGGRKASLWIPFLLSIIWALAITFGAGAYGTQLEEQGFNKAVALMDKGQNKEPEAFFKSYKARNPEDPTAYYNLALIYARTGRIEIAQQELKELLKLDPDNKDAKAFLKDLEIP